MEGKYFVIKTFKTCLGQNQISYENITCNSDFSRIIGTEATLKDHCMELP